MEELPERIKRLEKTHGSENRYVNMLKEQLRALKENKGRSAKETYLVSAKSRAKS